MKTTIYLATARGLTVLTGSDGNWRGAVDSNDKPIQCVATDLNRKGVVYCGTCGDGMFRSDDGGATWKASRAFTNPQVTALSASDSGAVYAGTEPGKSWLMPYLATIKHDCKLLDYRCSVPIFSEFG